MKYNQNLIVVWSAELSLKSLHVFFTQVDCINVIGKSVVGQMSAGHIIEILR